MKNTIWFGLRRRMAGVLTVCLALSLAGGLASVQPAVQAQTVSATGETSRTASSGSVEPDYTDYAAAHTGVDVGAAPIVLPGAAYAVDSGAGVAPEPDADGAIRWSSEAGAVSWRFSVDADGLYTVRLTYCPLPGRAGDIRLGLRLDGSYPFSEARELSFPRLWTDARRQTDSQGNESVPEQIEVEQYTERAAQDVVGRHNGAYVLRLTAGAHELELVAVSEPFLLRCIRLEPAAAAVPYAQVQQPAGVDYTGAPIVIEGEDALYKSASSLLPQADTDSAGIRPTDPTRTVLNYIGGTGWKSLGQTVVWRITVPQDGYYRLGATYRQNTVVNGVSYRSLQIDGQTPFAEAETWAFPYENGWAYTDFSAGKGDPYRLYLTAGEHELSLSVSIGSMASSRTALERLVEDIGDLYIQIHMITGEFPDANRSYELFRQIPQFNETLEDIAGRLEQLAAQIEQQTGTHSGNLVASLNNMRRVIAIMLENPYAAHQYKSDYYSNYNTVSSWLYEMTSMPLAIDALYLQAPGTEGAARSTGFFRSLRYTVQRFAHSFSRDYGTASGGDTGERLTLWLSSSFDQVQVVQSLLRDSFTATEHIEVDVKLVNTSLVQGLLSGDFPDCSFGMAHADPVNLAIRDALLDLTQFSDFDEVAGRFRANACLPYQYNGGCYALPDSQSFRVQFYRRDIFQAMGLSVPQTWEEYAQVAAELMRNNMQVGLPYTALSGPEMMSSGIAGMSLLPTMLLQYGVPLYNEEQTACRLGEPDVLEVFTQLTDFYTKKGFPLTADFYNQFRSGLMPLGIQPYTLYTTLDEMAPDIRGRWDIAPLPGVRQADGTVDRTDAASGSGAAIVRRSAHPEAAWKLLKWWTSADTQVRYSQGMENRLGATGRQAVSNQAALSRLSWKTETLKTLEQQGQSVDEYPELPGGYYMSRAIDQAFWNVTSNGKRPKDMLFKWSEIANREIARKMREYPAGDR